MQYINYYPQIIDELKMKECQTLFESKNGSIVIKFEDCDSFKELITVYNHHKKELQEKNTIFGQNSIQVDNQIILLCNCNYEMRYTKIKSNEGLYILILYNQKGKEFFIIQSQTSFNKIQSFIKRFCISKFYQSKYELIEQQSFLPISQNFKTLEQFCTIVIDKKQLITEQDFKVFFNSIIIMNQTDLSTKIFRIYEDINKFYLLLSNMKLQSLETLLFNDFDFKETTLVSIFYIVLQILYKYYSLGIYHGNLSLKTIFINLNSPILQVLLLFPKYQINTNNQKNSIDLKNLGLILYQISYYEKKMKLKNNIDLQLIKESQIELQKSNETIQNQFRFLFRISQLDFLSQLQNQNFTFDNALKHQWFVTVKQNLKQDQNKFLSTKFQNQYLHTIIESNHELSFSFNQDQRISTKQLQDSEVEDEYPLKSEIINPFLMIPSKLKHDRHQQTIGKSKSVPIIDILESDRSLLQKQPSIK